MSPNRSAGTRLWYGSYLGFVVFEGKGGYNILFLPPSCTNVMICWWPTQREADIQPDPLLKS